MSGTAAVAAVVFSHLGGLDEIAMLAVPAAAIIVFLRRSERKAQERQAARAAPDVEAPSADR
ncbi:MAG TPA: hypothetical protein VK011_04950 [Acidimicrobiia bacterium]|nr:hypothetical protein [Acidimicrobiia bacterium]